MSELWDDPNRQAVGLAQPAQGAGQAHPPPKPRLRVPRPWTR